MPQSLAPKPRREIREIARVLLTLDRRARQHAIPALIRLVEHAEGADDLVGPPSAPDERRRANSGDN